MIFPGYDEAKAAGPKALGAYISKTRDDLIELILNQFPNRGVDPYRWLDPSARITELVCQIFQHDMESDLFGNGILWIEDTCREMLNDPNFKIIIDQD